jgi:hypothetical protein
MCTSFFSICVLQVTLFVVVYVSDIYNSLICTFFCGVSCYTRQYIFTSKGMQRRLITILGQVLRRVPARKQ